MLKFFYPFFLFSSILLLNGCDAGSSDSSSDTSTSYFKIYNAAANSGTQQVYLDDEWMGSLSFARSYANYSLGNTEYALSLQRTSEDNELVEVYAADVDLNYDVMTMLFLCGDITDPQVVSFEYDFTSVDDLALDDDEEGDEQFELYIAHMDAEAADYDIYLSTSEETFSDAQRVTSLGYQEISEKIILPQDSYILYLVEPGSNDVIFTSTAISLEALDTFFLVIRENFGTSAIAVDRLASYSSVSSYVDQVADGQVAIYQSVEQLGKVDIYSGDTSQSPQLVGLAADTLSDEIRLAKGTYALSATSEGDSATVLLRNMLLNLNEGESKLLVTYLDDEQTLQTLSLSKQSRPLAYENALTLVNIATDLDDINLYFIPDDENLETTPYSVKNLKFANSRDINLSQQQYTILVTHEQDSGNQQLLYQSQPMTLDANTNFLLIVEPDDNEFSGYRLSILAE